MGKNENCAASDSVLCKWLDRDCKDCYIHSVKKDEAEEALNNFNITLSLLPEGFDDLQGEQCAFCKGEQKNPRDGYAVIDLAHAEPEYKRGMFFGFGKKVRQRIGSLMPVSISVCRRCRTSFRIVETMKWLSILVFVGIPIALMCIPSIGKAIKGVSPALPFGIVLAAAAVGYYLGKVFSGLYVKANSKRMAFNIFDIPAGAEMKEKGWFPLQDDGDVTHILFSKKSHTRKLSEIGFKSE